MLFNQLWVQISSPFVPSALSYTGDYTESSITYNDAPYKLYTLTSSGTLTVSQSTSADIWICGGGNGGGQSANSGSGGTSNNSCGGAGAYCASLSEQSLQGDYMVSVAAGGGASYIVDSANTRILETSITNGHNGGTGGASSGRWWSSGGTGDGIAKYPFGDSTFFRCHCAGGGSGSRVGYDRENDTYYRYGGGVGGTNGGNGNIGGSYGDGGGAGGDYGGGLGGSSPSNPSAGHPATFYGGGGGGNGYNDNSSLPQQNGGAGYQGVVYIRIPE